MTKNDYGKLINGKLAVGIPSTYRRPDGRTISNYDLQSIKVWIADGFMFIKRVFPKLTIGKDYSGNFSTKEENGELVLTYGVKDIVEEPEIITVQNLQIQIDEIKQMLIDNLGVIFSDIR